MRKTIKFLGILVALSILVGFMSRDIVMAQPKDYNGVQIITSMVESIREKDWAAFSGLMCASEQEYYDVYFANSDYTNGIKQIKDIALHDIYEVDPSKVQDELLTEEYPILAESNIIQTYIVALDCEVDKENQYFFDGVNYFLIVLAEEENEMKIVQFNRPTAKILSEVVEPTLSSVNSDYENEVAGINVIRQAEGGLIVNANNDVLTDSFKIVTVTPVLEEGDEYGIGLLADYPLLGAYIKYSYPTTISVKLDKTGNNKIVTVDFNTYIKNTLPNEWYASWSSESLKAGAYCVKMVGWYRVIKPISSAGGYDLTQKTQNYTPDTSKTASDAAVDAIAGSGMANSSDLLFFPEYARGTEGSAGTESGGQLKQWGSQYLATELNYTASQILNYYYKGSDYSSGSLKFFSYSNGVGEIY